MMPLSSAHIHKVDQTSPGQNRTCCISTQDQFIFIKVCKQLICHASQYLLHYSQTRVPCSSIHDPKIAVLALCAVMTCQVRPPCIVKLAGQILL